ncbi:unnamed protein product [Rhizophagus irregularis]|nr:unnamed protein product [Rhizophagus irregularis]
MLRGSRDGEEILGGYNPLEWKSQEGYNFYSNTKDSFVFSFENVDNIERHILSRVKDEKTAIYNVKYFGPLFGFSGDDLTTNGEMGYCNVKSYEKQIRKTTDFLL